MKTKTIDGRTLSYQYDAAGNTARMTSPFGTVTYGYDAKNRLAVVTDPSIGRFEFTYDELDRRTQLKYPNGVTTNYVYDDASRMTAIAAKDAQGTIVDAWSYQYDAVGNRTSKTDMSGRSETYRYDVVDRLAEANYTDGTFEKFTYDKVGNRLSRADESGIIAYTFDAANQLKTAGAPRRSPTTRTATKLPAPQHTGRDHCSI